MVDYPKPITRQSLSKILEQMEQSIYLKKQKDGDSIVGFFCNIKYNNNNKIPVLITNDNIKDFKYNKKISIPLPNNSKTIELGETLYQNKDYQLTIIELKYHDNLKLNFLEIDEKLYEKGSEIEYEKESIYVLNYNTKDEISVSYGNINSIYKSKMIYLSNIYSNTNFFPIFNLSNNKLIGINLVNRSNYFNMGIFLTSLISEFVNRYKHIKKFQLKYNKNIINEINILVKIDKKDINKEIYFLDNIEYKDKEGINHLHDNLKELNTLNTELFIDNNKYGFKKFFRPSKEGEYKINIKFNITLTDCSYMFAECENIININFISFNTKQITTMKQMFFNCNNLQYINLLSFDTRSVINMKSMFSQCGKLINLDLSSFNTKNVTEMSFMFFRCSNLINLNISSFNTKNVINMSYMFAKCDNLKNIDLSSFETINVTDMNAMFLSCSNIIYLDITSLNTKNVKNMCFLHVIN